MSSFDYQKANEQIFPTNGEFGGTEYVRKKFIEEVCPLLPKLNRYHCILFPGAMPISEMEMAESGKKLIFWIHNLPKQFDEMVVFKIFNDKRIQNNLKYIVVVSEYHKKMILEQTTIPENKIFVIHNFVDRIDGDLDRFNNVDKIKIVHCSSADRGMDVLIQTTEFIDEQNVEFLIFNNFYPDNLNFVGEKVFKVKDDRIIYYGKTPRKTLQKYLSSSHIYAYPATFLETFCLSQAEGMSAGLLPVYNDIGSLGEISSKFGIKYGGYHNFNHVSMFSQSLNEAIKKIRSNEFNPREQIEYINNTFSMEKFKNRWLELHDLL